MKERVREEITPINIKPGDTISLRYKEYIGMKELDIEILKENISRKMVVDEAVIFDVEEGDFDGATDGIGGAFLVTKKRQKWVK